MLVSHQWMYEDNQYIMDPNYNPWKDNNLYVLEKQAPALLCIKCSMCNVY